MRLDEAKDQIAIKYGFNDWTEIEHHPPFMWEGMMLIGESDVWNDVAKLYASEKVRNALKLASNEVELIYHDGTTKKETAHDQVNIGNNHIRPNRGKIIALEGGIVEQINEEP